MTDKQMFNISEKFDRCTTGFDWMNVWDEDDAIPILHVYSITIKMAFSCVNCIQRNDLHQ